MIKKLIINADDFGLTEGITKGIIDSHADGILTSTTMLVNAPYTKKAIELAKGYPKLGVGIHLNATMGRPLIPGKKSFTDELGRFIKVTAYPNRYVEVDPSELYEEWQAQMKQFIALTSKLPTHIDSHHHVHMAPVHHSVVLKLAKEYDLPVRQTSRHHTEKIITDYEDVHFYGDFYGEDLTEASIISVLDHQAEAMEIMCHPAYLDQVTYDMSSYQLPRVKEMAILRSKPLRKYIEDANIALITYGDLQKRGVQSNGELKKKSECNGDK